MTQNQTHLTVDDILSIGRRALDKTHGTEAQHIYIAREVERRLLASGAASTLAQPASVPAGWKLVPVQSTPEMRRAADDYEFFTKQRPQGMWWWGRIYEAMLAAAPQAPQPAQAQAALAKGVEEPFVTSDMLRAALDDLKANHQVVPSMHAMSSALHAALSAAPQPEAQPQWQLPAQRLVQWLHCMSYNDSYFGEPAGYLKQCVNELKHLLPPNEVRAATSAQAPQCTCPSGDGSLRWPCPVHPPSAQAVPTLAELREKLGGWDVPEVSGKQAEQGGK